MASKPLRYRQMPCAIGALANNDGHGFFGALNDAVVTGPTLTNINDFRAVLIEAPGQSVQ